MYIHLVYLRYFKLYTRPTIVTSHQPFCKKIDRNNIFERTVYVYAIHINIKYNISNELLPEEIIDF